MSPEYRSRPWRTIAPGSPSRRRRRGTVLAAAAAVAVLLVATVVGVRATRGGDDAPRDTALEHHLALYATAQLINGQLLASDSAAMTLTRWCLDHDLASPATVTAGFVRGDTVPATPGQRSALRVGGEEPVRYWSVRLSCGQALLSRVETWFVPARVGEELVTRLEDEETPFEQVVASLNPQRHNLESAWLWPVLPEGWEATDTATLRRYVAARPGLAAPVDPDRELFRHQAMITRGLDGLPIALMYETYHWDLVGFRTPYNPATAGGSTR